MLIATPDLAASWIDLLIRESLYAGVVFAVVLGLSRLLRRRGPSLHVALWSLVFIRLVLPPGVSHPLSAGVIVKRFAEYRAVVTAHSGAEHDGIPELGIMDSEGRDSIRGTADSSRSKAVLAVLWLSGFTVVWMGQRRRLRVFVQAGERGHLCDETAVLMLVERWRRVLGIRRKLRVVTSDEGLPPFTLGVFRPVIYIPATIVNDEESLEPVIAHEMAHVLRLDALWLRLQQVVQAVYFFHPLVWISGIKLNEERERLCDATVVAVGDLTARKYVGGLLNVLRLDLQGVGAPTMTVRKRRIGVRIQSVLSRDLGRRPRVAAAVVSVALLGIFLLPLSQGSANSLSSDAVAPVEESSPPPVAGVTRFINPLPDGRVTWTWGPGKRDPFTGKKVFHRGIDVAADAGTKIVAPADGVVIVATENFEESPSYGTVVIIDHGSGLTTAYSHLASFEVDEGQEISRGEVIAAVGSTGKSTGPHLHFEVRRDGESQDPATFVEEWKK